MNRVKQPSSFRRIFIVAGILSLFASYLGVWMRFINDPVERTGADFIHFYSAGRIAQNDGMEHVYDLSLQLEVEEEQIGFPLAPSQLLPYNHLPFLIPILRAVMSENYVTSFYRWVFILIFLYAAGLGIVSRLLKQAGIDQNTSLITAVGGMLFLPVFFSLMNGQDTAFLFLGAAIWMYGLISGRDTLAGLGLGLTTVRPHIALILAVPMLFRYRKAFIGFIVSAGILALISFLILGLDGTKEFIHIIFLSARGEGYGIKPYAMYNLIGLLTRALPSLGLETIRAIGWSVYGIAIISLCILWAKNKDLQDGRIGLTVVLALVTGPHLNFHDMALLLIPVYGLILMRVKGVKLRAEIAALLPIGISLGLLLGNASPFLQYTIPYLIMSALAGYPYYLKRKLSAIRQHQS